MTGRKNDIEDLVVIESVGFGYGLLKPRRASRREEEEMLVGWQNLSATRT